MLPKTRILFLLALFALGLTKNQAQEDNPYFGYEVPSQNLLKYNRFLINPTFSTVREDKSYINLLHRNQSVQFDDNNQNYFLSYSGRISDRTGLGLSLYTQRLGALSNYGVLANYAYGVKLSDKSNFTFGANLSYYNSGFDEGRATTVEEDPFLAGFQDQNLISFQPGFNLSYGNFDIGAFAENLFDYNLKTSESLTDFSNKTYSGHLQYTHQFKNSSGILEAGRLMPLARVRMDGEEDNVTLGGSLILDLPKIGWIQGGYDSFYGAAAGVGFNLNQRISLGYTMEKGLSNNFDNFGLTHEISFAYSFTPNLTEDRVMLEDDNYDDLVENDLELEPENIATNEEIEELKRKLAENDAIIEELMFRQDSLESNRQADLERRFNMVMRMVRNETNGERPDLEKRAEDLFKGEDTAVKLAAAQNMDNDKDKEINTNQNKIERDAIVVNTKKPTLSKTNNAKDRNTEASALVKNTDKDAITQVPARRKRIVDKPENAVVQDRVKSRKFRDLPNVTDGYYVVANVYKGGQYLDKFLNTLESNGINADYIDNPNNGLKYVYLERYDTWDEAVAAHDSNLNGAYEGKTWIMNVENRYTNEAYVDNVNKLREKSSKYDTDVLRKNVVAQDKVASNSTEPKNYEFDGIGSGYYIIANVFANPRNANRFVSLLNSYGLSASYFINPENNWRYVYLKRHDSWTNALISYYSKMNDAYDDKMWIMRVSQSQMT
ncbi:type IX secretion system membrane protein PorP/SprF [Maribacter sp. PR1]|uniref:Type IX secretion system membrane protein PorP/SprF n=1 Tax=Maribacter cobaltidurans TaxID=1178778 RepID=A0ABU7IQP1_9FLAO|nr:MULTISPECIES: type IX secretion system membrane protein PorP/SprF [Maribacter]MDC6387821.1 type IX secretion system membrane protein PorP/SprF [Maribacter sp. PR1]MEE1975210.1 type IX secretion system membrane protein PorP/SprF [Maribacter cobaltidurans]